MKVTVLTDTTLTVKAGQTIEVIDSEAPLLIRLGRVEEVKEPKKAPKKK